MLCNVTEGAAWHAGPGMNGGGVVHMKDSASSVPSGELSTQPYIGTDDSGCGLSPHHCSSCLLLGNNCHS